jgi:hypothetical protein
MAATMATGVRLTLRYAGIAMLAVTLAALHIRRPATVCVLRETTGLPCPFCGGTTAAVDLGRGRVPAAMAASPLAVVALAALPLRGLVRSPEWLSGLSRRHVAWLVAAALVTSELYELHRFHVFGA